MLPLDSVVGELHIVNGRRQSTPSFTGAFTAPRRSARGRQDDALFILAEGSGSAGLAAELLQRIQQTYWHTPGSVTAGLRTAIDTANEWLIERNLSAPAPARVGVSCAVLRGSEVFIVQAGPSCAHVAHQGRLERFPRADGAASSLPALGAARAVEMRFSHAELHPGDVLLLTDSALTARTPEQAIASAIVYVGVETALRNLEQLAGQDNLIAMVIEVAAAPAPQPAAAAAAGPARPAAPPPSQPAGPSPAARVGEWAGAMGAGVARSIRSAGTAAKSMAQRTLPDRPAPPARARGRPSTSPRAADRRTRLMLVIAIGLPICIAVIVSVVYLQRSAGAQADTLLREAQALLVQADSAPGGDAKRANWQAALDKANQALGLDPGNAAATQVRAQAQGQLDRLDGTQRLSPTLLHDYKRIGRHRLAGQDANLFVMDQPEGFVDRMLLNAASDALAEPPALAVTRGFNVDDRLVGELIDMVWAEAGQARQKSTLLVLERGGLVDYDLGFGPADVPFAESNVAPGVIRIDAFDGNLYLLDVSGRQIWKYVPETDGYTGVPTGYFETPPAGIDAAIDMAIDGNVYLLLADGRVLKYLGGEPQSFELAGLPAPIAQPVAIAVDPNSPQDSHVYVADAADGRIIEFAPDGRYVRQYRSPGQEFDAIEDLMVDERIGRLVVISNGQLYSAALSTAP